jgi:hypothetical protein
MATLSPFYTEVEESFANLITESMTWLYVICWP